MNKQLPSPATQRIAPLTWQLSVVIPTYRVRRHILDVISAIGPEISRIYVVDDACPEDTGAHVEQNCRDDRVIVLRNINNRGVGGAMIRGYKQAIADGSNLVVKLDGDGQMDPLLIPRLVAPIIAGDADYAKGNRLFELRSVLSIPPLRMVGNIALSIITKISTGYWHIVDPVNGYTAISSRTLSEINLENISQGYFFETDMLGALHALNCKITEIPMPARYGDEKSNLCIARVIPEFTTKHLLMFCRRINRLAKG